jgi:hypothetical protein
MEIDGPWAVDCGESERRIADLQVGLRHVSLRARVTDKSKARTVQSRERSPLVLCAGANPVRRCGADSAASVEQSDRFHREERHSNYSRGHREAFHGKNAVIYPKKNRKHLKSALKKPKA